MSKTVSHKSIFKLIPEWAVSARTAANYCSLTPLGDFSMGG